MSQDILSMNICCTTLCFKNIYYVGFFHKTTSVSCVYGAAVYYHYISRTKHLATMTRADSCCIFHAKIISNKYSPLSTFFMHQNMSCVMYNVIIILIFKKCLLGDASIFIFIITFIYLVLDILCFIFVFVI